MTIVRRGGGVRCGAIDGSVTHVVMGTKEVKVLEQAQQLGAEVKVVRPQWLLESCAQGSKLAEENYGYVESAEKGRQHEQQNAPDKKK